MQTRILALAAGALLGTAGHASAGQVPAPPTAIEAPAQTPATVTLSQDARETRQELEAILKRLPPAVGRVLRTDPSLMRNQSYLATYPQLASFLQQHPEIANNAGYYLENITVQFWNPSPVPNPRADAIYMWRETFEGIAMLIVFLVITSGVLWLARTVLQHRRWYRTFKVQTDLHNKMVDRVTSNEDLLAYFRTPGNRGFLDAPLAVEPPAQPVATPFNRILWSVQAGLVLAAGAVGLLFISRRVVEEVAQVFFAVGVLALALGVGFVISAAASFLLSQRLGLLGGAAAREHSGPTGA